MPEAPRNVQATGPDRAKCGCTARNQLFYVTIAYKYYDNQTSTGINIFSGRVCEIWLGALRGVPAYQVAKQSSCIEFAVETNGTVAESSSGVPQETNYIVAGQSTFRDQYFEQCRANQTGG